MRLKEILREDYTEDLMSDVTNLLLTAKSNGHNSVKTANLVRQLRSMGYTSVDLNSILPLLQSNPVIMSANDGTIELKGQTPAPSAEEDSATKVKQLANKASDL